MSDAAEEKRTVEEWAEAAGYLPEVFGATAPAARATAHAVDGFPGLVSVAGIGGALGAVRSRRNPETWRFAAARAFHRWPIGMELTRAEFDAAVHAAITHPMG